MGHAREEVGQRAAAGVGGRRGGGRGRVGVRASAARGQVAAASHGGGREGPAAQRRDVGIGSGCGSGCGSELVLGQSTCEHLRTRPGH